MHRGLLALVLVFLVGCATPPPPVSRTPPAPREDPRGLKPGPDYFWKPGRWSYNASIDDYSWVPGQWEPDRPNMIFIPGYWQAVDGGWVYREERWEEKGR